MSFTVIAREVLDQALPKSVSEKSRDDAVAAMQAEFLATIRDSAVRREVYDIAAEDPVLGDEIDMMSIALVLDTLAKVIDGA